MPHKVATLLLFGLSLSAFADQVVVDTSDRGYYYATDFHEGSNKNYLTGQLTVNVLGQDITNDYHSYFVFNALSGLSGPIVSATLSLFNPDFGYSSTQASEQLVIDIFSGSISDLETTGTQSGIYNGLASGTTIGTATVSAADNAQFVDIVLNADAIAFLNINGGNAFAFGGYLSGISGTDTRYVFGASNFVVAGDANTYLTVKTEASAVPEPRAWLFLVTGFAVIGMLAQRRGHRAAAGACSQMKKLLVLGLVVADAWIPANAMTYGRERIRPRRM